MPTDGVADSPGHGTELTPSVRCEACGHDVPSSAYCVRCGNALHRAPESAPGSRRRRRTADYAASPGEPVLAIRIVSTLFPHLPRAHVEAFRWSLIIGAAAIVAPAAAGLYPVALIVAAFAVPVVIVLYLYAVEVYEDEPVRVVAATAAWGVVAGIVSGLLAGVLSLPNPVADGASRGSEIITGGVVVPLIGAALASIGPLLLLRYRKFNDVLDGTTFGVIAGSWFVGAQALAIGVGTLAGGLRPPGDPSAWIARLLALGVVSPVLWSATLGSVMGALWLRYRAPVHDRAALGLVGDPAVAALAGVIVLSAAAIGQLLLTETWALVWLAVLAALPLIWLRRTIHLGLLEESAEGEIGLAVRCWNCERLTPHHTFCAHCGIALRALPKVRHGRRIHSDEPRADLGGKALAGRAVARDPETDT